jgi:hypothetical protein
VTRRRYNGPHNQAVIFEFAQVHRQRVLRDARPRSAQHTEPHCTVRPRESLIKLGLVRR